MSRGADRANTIKRRATRDSARAVRLRAALAKRQPPRDPAHNAAPVKA